MPAAAVWPAMPAALPSAPLGVAAAGATGAARSAAGAAPACCCCCCSSSFSFCAARSDSSASFSLRRRRVNQSCDEGQRVNGFTTMQNSTCLHPNHRAACHDAAHAERGRLQGSRRIQQRLRCGTARAAATVAAPSALTATCCTVRPIFSPSTRLISSLGYWLTAATGGRC